MNLKSLTALAVCIASVAAIAATSTPKGFTDDLDAALHETYYTTIFQPLLSVAITESCTIK